MNKKLSKLVALLLCFALVFTATVPVFAADNDAQQTDSAYLEHVEQMEKKASTISKLLNFLLNDVLLKAISRVIPNFSFVEKYDKNSQPSLSFTGTEKFIGTSTGKYTWRVGYDSESIIPDDFGKPLKYARGSYCPWGYSKDFYKDEDGNDEDLKVRTVIFDDCTGRGLTVFASVDCIGLSNYDVNKIRSAVSDFAKEKNIVSINVSAIHTHMGIDSQGVWNAPLTTVANNALSLTGIVDTKSGVNEDYLKTIINRTKTSIEKAYADMKEGMLTFAKIDLPDYLMDRTTPNACDTNMYRLMFTPADNSRGTVIASFGAHPEVTSYDNEFVTSLSSDFVYYMEKLVNKAGSNFMYLQGNVGTNKGIFSGTDDGLDISRHEQAIRYGYEMAYILLTMTDNTEKRIAVNDELGDVLGVKEHSGKEKYTVWYNKLPTVEEQKIDAVLNIRNKPIVLEMENSTAQILIKLGLASNKIAYDNASRKYYTETEIGYAEFGNAFKAILSPGELYGELVVGGRGIKGFEYKSLREIFGENVVVFDLMNDAAGYVCPDDTYAVVGYKYNLEKDSLESDAWCLTVSIGKNTASTLFREYIALVNETK